MAYATIYELQKVLPKTVTIGNNQGDPNTSKPDTMTIQSAGTYLDFASQYINGRLRTIYFCPLQRTKAIEVEATQDMVAASDILYVPDSGEFNLGAMVRISDGNNTETHFVTELFETDPSRLGQFRIDKPLTNTYLAATPTYISMLRFPDPIPLTCAQLAAAQAIDRIFVTEQAPDVPTGYGKLQRSLASAALDAILAGAIRLDGQEFTGRRFVPTQLFDTPKATTQFQAGSGKE